MSLSIGAIVGIAIASVVVITAGGTMIAKRKTRKNTHSSKEAKKSSSSLSFKSVKSGSKKSSSSSFKSANSHNSSKKSSGRRENSPESKHDKFSSNDTSSPGPRTSSSDPSVNKRRILRKYRISNSGDIPYDNLIMAHGKKKTKKKQV
jgi:hypothetical protein